MRAISVAWPALLATLFLLAGCGSGGVGSFGSAHDFKVESVSEPGKMASLADYQGKVVLLEFWATWCGPCRETMPVIDGIYKDYVDQGLNIVSMTDETREAVESFLRDHPHSYPMFLDADGKASKAYGVDGIPDAVLIGKDGKIVWRGHPGEEQALREAIQRALG